MRLLAPWEADLFAVVPATRFDLGYCSIESSMPIHRTVDQLVRVNPGSPFALRIWMLKPLPVIVDVNAFGITA